MRGIVNETNGAIVSHEYKKAKSLFDNAFGLLLKSNPRTMVFVTRFGIHTFFMRKKIDVLVLDEENRVVKIKEGLLPNRIYLWNPEFFQVVELPFGAIDKSKTKIGARLELK